MNLLYQLCRRITATRKIRGPFQVRFYRDYFNRRSAFVFIGEAATLEQAKALRKTNGDLVTDSRGNVVRSEQWLWNWERKDSKSLAKMAVRRADVRFSAEDCRD